MVSITTDTASICLFDPTCLKHRKEDVGDWWSIPRNELEEINGANALIINLGSDGTYNVHICDQPVEGNRYELKVPSGRLFIGPGEELSGGGFEPDGNWGGIFVSVKPGIYTCTIARNSYDIRIYLVAAGKGVNNLTDLIRI